MTAEETKKKWDAKRVALVVLTWVAAFLILEAGVRITHPEAGRPVYPGYPAGMVVLDPDLGHAHKPNFSGFFPQPRYADIPISINSYGFRDVEWTKTPDPARPRVMVLGDSVVFGTPLRVEERFTEQAAAILLSRGKPVEFCNYGVNGYNVEQYNALLRLRGPELAPCLVLAGLVLNDAEPLSEGDARAIAMNRGVREGRATARFEKAAMNLRLDPGQSYAWNFFARMLKSRLWQSGRYGKKMADRYTEKTAGELTELYNTGSGLARLKSNFAEMKSFAKEKLGADLAVLVFVYRHQIVKSDPAIIKKVDALLADLAIPHADLYDAFLPHREDENLYADQDDCHPSAIGHKLAGGVTADLIGALIP